SDAVILQKGEGNFLGSSTDRHGKNIAVSRLKCGSIFQSECGNSLAIEFSIRDGEQSGVLAAFLDGDGDELEVALIIESSFFDKLRVIRVGLWFRHPGVELRNEGCLTKFAEI